MDICKYPNQIAVVKRKSVTLGIDAYLSLAGSITNAKGEEIILPPLGMHSPMSCFKWTLIDKASAQTVFPTANIPCADVNTLKIKIDAIIGQVTVSGSRQQDHKNQKRPAYTTLIRVNKFRGKTPASILLENEENFEPLLETAKFLREQESESKYAESNRLQIEAIEEAIALYQAGELSADYISENESIVVYDQPNKILTSRKPIEMDHFFCYAIKIEYLKGFNYPWQISINNSFVRIRKRENGMREAVSGSAINESRSRIQISDYEIGNIIGRMYASMQLFEMIYFKGQYNRLIKLNEDLKKLIDSEAA